MGSPALISVLVVDGDATSRRFVELALGRAGFTVETAQNGGAALETLTTELFDLIICETELDDMDGLSFFRRLSAQHRLRAIPFLFLSADKDVATKVNALRAGADDYLVKPCDFVELIARVESLVGKQRKLRESISSRSFSLACDVSVIPFADIIALLEMTRRTGVLSLVTPNISGRLHFEHGNIFHAECGNLLGQEAFFRLFVETSGRFEFSLTASHTEQRTITVSATALILEAARLRDTEIRDEPDLDHDTIDIPMNVERPVPVSSPTNEPLARWEVLLRDKFALGELSLWTEKTLAEWTGSDLGRERFHVLMVADLPAGVAAMMPLGTSPNEQWILEALRETKKIFGVTFFLKRDRVVDLILVDASDPTALLSSLQRTPGVMLICPPDGNLLALGSTAIAGLDQLIRTLAPPAILGVGGEGLAAAISGLGAVRESSILVGEARGTLTSGPKDLRELLIDAVELTRSQNS